MYVHNCFFTKICRIFVLKNPIFCSELLDLVIFFGSHDFNIMIKLLPNIIDSQVYFDIGKWDARQVCAQPKNG